MNAKVTFDPNEIPHWLEFADDVVSALRLMAQNCDDAELDASAAVQEWLANLIYEQARPKPPEPNGYLAIVQDRNGEVWINYRDPRKNVVHHTPWVNADDPEMYSDYADIDVVRVLSEGVTP